MNQVHAFSGCEKTCAHISQCEHGCIGYRSARPVELSPVMVQAFVLIARGGDLVDAVDEEMERQGRCC